MNLFFDENKRWISALVTAWHQSRRVQNFDAYQLILERYLFWLDHVPHQRDYPLSTLIRQEEKLRPLFAPYEFFGAIDVMMTYSVFYSSQHVLDLQTYPLDPDCIERHCKTHIFVTGFPLTTMDIIARASTMVKFKVDRQKDGLSAADIRSLAQSKDAGVESAVRLQHFLVRKGRHPVLWNKDSMHEARQRLAGEGSFDQLARTSEILFTLGLQHQFGGINAAAPFLLPPGAEWHCADCRDTPMDEPPTHRVVRRGHNLHTHESIVLDEVNDCQPIGPKHGNIATVIPLVPRPS